MAGRQSTPGLDRDRLPNKGAYTVASTSMTSLGGWTHQWKDLPGPQGDGWAVRLLPPRHGSWGRRPRCLTRASCVNVDDPEPGSG
eukprot:8980893-Pyramimonas_sp.AAC.1